MKRFGWRALALTLLLLLLGLWLIFAARQAASGDGPGGHARGMYYHAPARPTAPRFSLRAP